MQLLGVASIAASLNFIITIINLRAPGMTMMRLPVFTWMTLVTAFLIVLAFPAITIALIELMMDRLFGTNFFEVSNGGMPILWTHLFWVFGHPEVYILILPGMGVISEILPTFSRKPLYGYPIVVFSGACIGFLGFGVWSHHMFTTGMGTMGTAAFALTTMVIAVPTGVKIFNWIGTLWGGHISMRTPMMFALGFIWMFMLGGFSGVMHAAAPADAEQHNSYFVVAHFHYVLIGGSLFSLLAGIHYWFPLMFGRQVSEFWGKLSFWLVFIGFNVTFFPMHFLGLNGMPRRTFTYDRNMGWNTGNMIATIGAFILGSGVAVYFAVMIYTFFKGKVIKRDPWDARTLEWSLPTPPPEYNYRVIPTVHARDNWWYEKHHPGEEVAAALHAHEEEAHGGIHMPFQSIYPFIAGLGIFIGSFGVSVLDPDPGPGLIGKKLALCLFGFLVFFVAVYLWSLEGNEGYHIHPRGKPEELRKNIYEQRGRWRHRPPPRPDDVDGHSEQEAPDVGFSGLGLHVFRMPDLHASDLPPASAARRAAGPAGVQHRADLVLDVHPPDVVPHDGPGGQRHPEGQSQEPAGLDPHDDPVREHLPRLPGV